MQHFFRLILVLALAVPALAQRDIGTVDVNADTKTIPVTISCSSPELQGLAIQAFNPHGHYRAVASGGAYNLSFAAAGNQVTVTVTKGGAPVHTQIVAGASPRNALLRAADVAVAHTGGGRG